jgi:hypothetical protein
MGGSIGVIIDSSPSLNHLAQAVCHEMVDNMLKTSNTRKP